MSSLARGAMGRVDWSATRRLRWRLVLREIRKGLAAGTQSNTHLLKSYKCTKDYWTDALLEPMSAYDFADLLAVYCASEGAMSDHRPVPVVRQHVFDALREAANAAAPWIICARPKRIEVEQSWDATEMINIRVVPREAAEWLFQNAKARSLLPDSLCQYLLSARSPCTSVHMLPVVMTAELFAFMARPEIATLTRPAQWRAACEHFKPRWVPRARFKRVAAKNPRPSGRR